MKAHFAVDVYSPRSGAVGIPKYPLLESGAESTRDRRSICLCLALDERIVGLVLLDLGYKCQDSTSSSPDHNILGRLLTFAEHSPLFNRVWTLSTKAGKPTISQLTAVASTALVICTLPWLTAASAAAMTGKILSTKVAKDGLQYNPALKDKLTKGSLQGL